MRSDSDVSLAIKLLEDVKTGKEVADALNEAVKTRDLKVREYTEQIALLLDAPTSWRSLYSRKKAAAGIFLKFEEFGVSFVDLFHEAVHATDEEFEKNSRGATSKAHHQRTQFLSEKKAYGLQSQFLKEVSEKHACAKEYYKLQSEQGVVELSPGTDEAIIAAYGLNPDWALGKF